jgi:hypothetical protein
MTITAEMRINTNNHPKIDEALQQAEGRARTRKMDATDIQGFIEEAEERLAQFLNKGDWNGVRIRVSVGFGGKVPSSYKGTPEATFAIIERGSTAWFMVDAGRERARGADLHVDFLNLNEKTEEILRNVSKSI